MDQEQARRVDLGPATLDLVSDLSRLDATEEISAGFQNFVENLGFSSVACFKVPEVNEPLEDCVYMCTRPQAWVDRYIDQDYVRTDPIVRQVFRTTEPFLWSDIMEQSGLEPAALEMHRERQQFGLRDGLVVPIYETKGYAGLVSLAGEVEVTRELYHTVTVAAVFVHNRLVTRGRGRLLPDDLLTPREVECLKWACEGKSDWEIGHILKISSKTVNYHIENVKRKFGVTTRVQAIVSAFRYGKVG